jgi:hypothetical protein
VLCSIYGILQHVWSSSCLTCTLCPIAGCMQGIWLDYPVTLVNISRNIPYLPNERRTKDSEATVVTAAADNNGVGNYGPETLWRAWFPNRRLSSKRLLLTDRHFTLLYFRSAQKNFIRRLIQNQEKINSVPTKASASLAHSGEIRVPTPKHKRWLPAKVTNMITFTPSKHRIPC